MPRTPTPGHNFAVDQDVYRLGFESALRRECRGKTIDEETDILKWWYPDIWDTEAFRRGYARGKEFWEAQAAGETVTTQAR